MIVLFIILSPIFLLVFLAFWHEDYQDIKMHNLKCDFDRNLNEMNTASEMSIQKYSGFIKEIKG